MKTLKAVLLLACVLFVGAMLRMQHATFAERALRAELRRPAARWQGAVLASARVR